MLIEIESHAADLPRRLKEIDPDLWVAFNTAKGKYQVWGLDLASRPYPLASFDHLDGRVEDAIRRAYWVARNTGNPYRKQLEGIARAEDRQARADEKEAAEREYGMADHLRFSDTPVVTPGIQLEG